MAGKVGNRTLFDSENPGPIVSALVEVNDDRKFTFPPQITSRVSWLKSFCEGGEALATFDNPGLIVLDSWESGSPQIVEKRNELILDAGNSLDSLEALKVMEDRYRVFTIPKPNKGAKTPRPTLPLEAVVHLGLNLQSEPYMYIFAIGDKIELLSPAFRNTWRRIKTDVLPDLP